MPRLSGRCRGWNPCEEVPACTVTPTMAGNLWVEAEIHWIDGRRAFAAGTLSTYDPTGSLPFKLDAHTVALYHFDTGYQDSSKNRLNLTPSGNVFLTGSNRGWSSDPSGQVARFRGPGRYADGEYTEWIARTGEPSGADDAGGVCLSARLSCV